MIHLSPSNLNSWHELVNADEDSPPWVTPEKFKESIMGVFTKSVKSSAGNACSTFLFGGPSEFEENNWRFKVDDNLAQARCLFPFGAGVPEVPKLLVLDEEFDGEQVRLSMRADYLCKSVIAELKTSSRTFSKKGKTRDYLESMQAFSYMHAWGLPITFIFAEIGIKEKNGVNVISVKDISSATAYPSTVSSDRLIQCVRSLIPYLKSDEEMWNRVTTRKETEVL